MSSQHKRPGRTAKQERRKRAMRQAEARIRRADAALTRNLNFGRGEWERARDNALFEFAILQSRI
jgi:hypothetical protein